MTNPTTTVTLNDGTETTVDLEGLCALHRQGLIDGLPYARAFRTVAPAGQVGVGYRYRCSLAAAARYRKGVQRTTRYTDEALLARLADDPMPGDKAECTILLTVHPDDRRAVVRDANRFYNSTPDAGRWSDALASCARHYRPAAA